MIDIGSAVTEFVLTAIVGATILVIWYISSLFGAQKGKKIQNPVSDPLPAKQTSGHVAGSKHKKKQHTEKWSQKISKQNFTHQWMITSLKGHTGQVLDMDFSSDGKYLATCAEDGVVFFYSTKDYASKDRQLYRLNIEFDYATLISWSPDSKAFIINKHLEGTIEVYKVARKSECYITAVTKAITFPKQVEKTVGIGVAINGKYIMSCSHDNQLVIWDLKGGVLATVDTLLMYTFRAKISPCGRFVAASGFAPDVKVWEVQFTKSGEFKQVVRAFELKGHTSSVHDFGFSADSSRMATVSKDGTWKFFDTKIEFEKGEEPHLLMTAKYKSISKIASLALSPNGEVLAIASNSELSLFSTLTGDCDKIIDKIYDGSPSNKVLFDSAGDFILTTNGKRHVHVLHNVTGRRTAIATAKQKLKSSNNSAATKERLELLIKQAEDFLVQIGEPTRGGG